MMNWLSGSCCKANIMICLVFFVVLKAENTSASVYHSVIEVAGECLAVGSNGAIWKSSNAVTWVECPSEVTQDLNDIAWGDGVYVIVGTGGTILTSHDGLSWQLRNSNVTANLFNVLWSGCFFIALDENNTALTSIDGVNWDLREFSDPMLRYLVRTGDQSIPFGYPSSVIRMPDGTIWSSTMLLGVQSLSQLTWNETSLKMKYPVYSLTTLTEKTSYESWIIQVGLPVENSKPLDDANGDDVANVLAYAMGLNAKHPTTAEELSSLPLVAELVDGVNIRIAFKRPGVEREDMRYIVESSTSLLSNSWTQIVQRNPFGVWVGRGVVTEKMEADGRIVVAINDPIQGVIPKYFVRIRTELLSNE